MAKRKQQKLIRISFKEEFLKELEEILKRDFPILYETYSRDERRKYKNIVDYFLRFALRNYEALKKLDEMREEKENQDK